MYVTGTYISIAILRQKMISYCRMKHVGIPSDDAREMKVTVILGEQQPGFGSIYTPEV